MKMSVWRVIAVLGGVAVAVGLYLGFAPVHVTAAGASRSCGSAFLGGSSLSGNGLCSAPRNHRREAAIIVLAAGVVVGGFGLAQADANARVISAIRRQRDGERA